MSVTYEQAMETLTGMFSDVDKEVIGMILQANGGHMEKTVENLLAMSGQAEAARPAPQRAPPAQQQQQQPRASPPYQQQQHPQQQQPAPHYQQPAPQQYQQQQQQQQRSPYQVPSPYQAPSPYQPYSPPQQQQPHYPVQQPYPLYNPNYPPSQQPPPLYQQPYQPQYQPPMQQQRPPQQQLQQQQPPAHHRFESEQKSGPQPVAARAVAVQAPPQIRPAPVAAPAVDPAAAIYQIPDDFMRPPSFFEAIVGPPPAMLLQPPMPAPPAVASADVLSQIEQDHLLAQMIQDQQFLQDLANHPERYQNVAVAAGQPVPEPANASPAMRPQPQPQQQQTPRMAAPPAHPHSEVIGAEPYPIWTPPPRRNSGSVQQSASSSSAGPAAVVGIGSEPLHPRLESLHGGAPGSGPSKEQQSSFAKKWGSLTAGAREKLARLSERFKKDPNRDADLDGGGSYNQMQPLRDGDDGSSPIDRRSQQRKPLHSIDDRFAAMEDEEAAPGGGAHASFISAEEAAELQAGYAYGSSAKKGKNAFTVDDDADPFGDGANGSDVEPDDVSVSVGGAASSSSLPQRSTQLLPQMSRTISGVRANENEADEDAEEGYRPPRLSFDAGANNQHAASRPRGSSSGMHRSSAALVDPPSDDDDAPSVPAARKKSAASGVAPGANKKNAMPLLQDM